jgi:Lrp/AsnC family leucine-responsive transcriptional regulator
MRGTDVVRYLSAIPEVITCNVMSGDLDIVLNVETTSSERLNSIWADISKLPGVANTVTSFVLSQAK